MRMSDADKLTELCDIMAEKCDGIGESVWHQFRITVEWSPTVDAEPVVRCKDCKHWLVDCFQKMDAGNWWCADGERKGQNDE